MRRDRPSIQPGDGDPRHGTQNGYGNLQCRCTECRVAHARALYPQAGGRVLPPKDPRHGSSNAYRYWRCSCDLCRAGNTIRARIRRASGRR